jgi:F-type H+-transporting ATPase subunit epsilon
MADRVRLEVVTPTKRVVRLETAEVRLPATLGEIGVLPGHTPLLTTLGIGVVSAIDPGTTVTLAVFGGFAEILPDQVTILADAAEMAADIDVAAARAELQTAEAALKTAGADDLDEITASVRRAQTRLTVAGASTP